MFNVQLNALRSGLVCMELVLLISLNAFLNGRSYGLYSLVCITIINTEFGLIILVCNYATLSVLLYGRKSESLLVVFMDICVPCSRLN